MQLASASGTLNPKLWVDILLWPRVTKKSPAYWRDYCSPPSEPRGSDRWEELHAVPKGLTGLAAAAVLHVIVGAMTESEDGRIFDSFLNDEVIAQRAHVSERTVSRVLAWQDYAPTPLIALSRPGVTRGIHHECYRFTLVLNPLAFASARDAERRARGPRRSRRVRATTQRRGSSR